MASRALSFDVRVDEVSDSDDVQVNILPVGKLQPVDVEQLNLVNGQASVAFTNSRALEWPSVFQVQVKATRSADGQVKTSYLSIDNSPKIRPIDDASNDPVHPLVNFDIVARYLAYTRTRVNHTPTQTFSSVPALVAQLNSKRNHNGAVYALTGTHTITSQIEPSVINCIITTDPDNPATIDGGSDRTGAAGANFGFLLDDCANCEVSNFNITGMRYHGVMVGRENAEAGGLSNRILDNTITQCGTTGIAVRNLANGTLIEGNLISQIGSGTIRGEGIYLGEGNDSNDGVLSNHVFNTIVRGNTITDTNSEAIDAKRFTRGLIIRYNHIFDCSVNSQGAITLLIAISDSLNAEHDADIVCEFNVISGTIRRNYEGHGIVVGQGNALIRGNIIFNNDGFGISVYADFDGPNKTCTITENIIWNNALGSIQTNVGTGNGTAANDATVIRSLNYVDVDPVGNESTRNDFVGPFPAGDVLAFSPSASAGDLNIVELVCPVTVSAGDYTPTWFDNGGVPGRVYSVFIDGSFVGSANWPALQLASTVPLTPGNVSVELFVDDNKTGDDDMYLVDTCEFVATESTTSGPSTEPALTSHENFDVMPDGPVTFTWSANGNVLEGVAVRIGTTGSNTTKEYGALESYNDGTPTSLTTNSLPRNGRTFYVNFGWKINGQWKATVYEFTAFTDITAPPPSTAGWDNDRPFGGRLIGVPFQGWTVANSPAAVFSSRRFLCERSGFVTSLWHENRALTGSTIKRRRDDEIAGRRSGDTWTKVYNAVGEDGLRGGYMLSNPYSAGNGGLITCLLCADDGTPRHLPGAVLGQTLAYVPRDRPINKIIPFDLISPVSVSAGDILHIVYRNDNAPSKFKGMSASEAQNADVTKGIISLNGVSYYDIFSGDDKFGPYLRDVPRNFYKSSEGSSWKESALVTSWYALGYDDGVTVGDTYTRGMALSNQRHDVYGSKKVRQRIDYTGPDVTVDRVVAYRGHKDDFSNGDPLLVTVRNSSGNVLATGSIDSESDIKQDDSGNLGERYPAKHGIAALSNPVTLQTGQRYYLEESASSGARYRTMTCLQTDHAGSTDRNLFYDGKAEINDGSGWEDLSPFSSRDLAIYLIPVGQPDKTPIPNW